MPLHYQYRCVSEKLFVGNSPGDGLRGYTRKPGNPNPIDGVFGLRGVRKSLIDPLALGMALIQRYGAAAEILSNTNMPAMSAVWT